MERRPGLGQHRWDAGRARASTSSSGRAVGGGPHSSVAPLTPHPPALGAGSARPLFTGVQGNMGATGCRGSPPKHVCSRCARSESQPIRNIIYNNNNNNINNIRTSGSVFFPSTIWLEAEHPGDMTIGISVSNLA